MRISLALIAAGLLATVNAAAADGTIAKFRRALEQDEVYSVTWVGTFRRYDADGVLAAEFPSEIVATFDPGRSPPYYQTNTYQLPDGTVQEIVSEGEWRDGKLMFNNDRVQGWSVDLPPDQDPAGRSSVLYMNFKDGSGMYVYEIITLSDDGRSRARMTQYLVDGRVIRRTLIDEELEAESWSSRPD